MGTPGARLQGPFVSGSALALASWLPAPVATAPASMTPRSSNARRCSRPLPATGSGCEDAKSCVRFLRMLMVLSLDRRIISQKPNAIPALMRARRERPRCYRAAEQRDELSPSDGDCHTPLPCELRDGTIARHERAVFTSKEGRMLVKRPNKDARDRLHTDVGGTQQFALWATGKTQSDGSNAHRKSCSGGPMAQVDLWEKAADCERAI